MKTTKSNILLATLLFFTLCWAIISSAQAYSCKATIYNNSNKPWTFSNRPKSGNVHFGNNCPVNGPCEIAAGKTQAIIYTQTQGGARGFMSVIDYKNVSKTFDFYGSNDCPTPIGVHLPAVKANEPHDGDFTILADAWDEAAHTLKQ